jgi:hypothetical protein
MTENMENKNNNYVAPFFWQNGASEEVLKTELQRIYDSQVGAFCVEARPHPDFGGAGWWHDMDIIMDFARNHQMKVWLLDDDRFPSGHVNKIFSDGNHSLSVRFLTVHNTDVLGPVKGGYMQVKGLLTGDDELIGVVACKRCSGESDELLLETAIDLTKQVEFGWLNCDIPEGLWRILVFYTTRQGNGKLDYFNILDSASVRLLLEQVYQPHYEHYQNDFGHTFLGFFSDEPEFSNLPGYNFQAKLGSKMAYIPWSKELKDRLSQRWQENFLIKLTALWYQVGELTPHLRYEYMDETTKQLARSYADQISSWCQARGVSHIGHIVEDDNAHGRLGCSTGHYFRSLSGMRMAGIDIITHQVMPEMDQKYHQWMASDQDGEFFHYGLAKMGSSLAHVDLYKQGDSFCEIFGAYGWQAGIKLMKWLTDHMVSRGINHFVPHAFSMKPFPDPDAPPHFYAHGNYPQLPHFGLLMQYMNRLSHLFSGGTYPANIAVLYHAEAEWAGKAMLFQKPVRIMLEQQLDCDIIPADLLQEQNSYGATINQGIKLQNQNYQVLIIPECEYIPQHVADFILRYQTKVHVFFVGRHPLGICEETTNEADIIEKLHQIECTSLGQLAAAVKAVVSPMIQISGNQPKLRTYPYLGGDGNRYVFCFNEDPRKTITEKLEISDSACVRLLSYDVVRNDYSQLTFQYQDGKCLVDLELQPNEAKVLVLLTDTNHLPASNTEPDKQWGDSSRLDGSFEVSYRSVKDVEWHLLMECSGKEDFPDLTSWVAENEFCGILKYTTKLWSLDEKQQALIKLFGQLDCADVFVNGECLDRLLGTPAEAKIRLQKGENIIAIELPLTPIWSVDDFWSSLSVLPGIGLTEKPILYLERKEHE